MIISDQSRDDQAGKVADLCEAGIKISEQPNDDSYNHNTNNNNIIIIIIIIIIIHSWRLPRYQN